MILFAKILIKSNKKAVLEVNFMGNAKKIGKKLKW